MPCYHPIPARQDDNGVTLWPPVGTAELELPCGNCLGCRTNHARAWAARAAHEAAFWKHNCFLTLTYNQENLPNDGALRPVDLQKFLKRLRRAVDRRDHRLVLESPRRVRYLACGEYGNQSGRPHYHLCLFNLGFDQLTQVGKDLYTSEVIHDLWTAGEHRLANFTPATANYVAQYTFKKINGGTFVSPDGVILPQPFLRMSLKPAIGTRWLQKFYRDLQNGFIVTGERVQQIPRTYKNKLRELDPNLAEYSEYLARKAPRRQLNLRAAEIIHHARVNLTHHRTL